MLGLTPAVRLAFVGDPLRFSAWALGEPARGLEPLFVDASRRDARVELERFRPHVVVVFDVDAVASALYTGLGAPVLGVAAPDEERPVVAVTPRSARVPRRMRVELLLIGILRRVAPHRAQPRLAAAAEWRASQLPEPARPPWDRLVAIDPAAASGRELWRLIAPPVDDRIFTAPRHEHARARVVIASPSTAYREGLLLAAKHAHDVRHVAHGITPARLHELLSDTDVAIALRPHAGAAFPHGVALHLAAGHLVICDRTGHGLEPGIDVLAVDDDRALEHAVGAARAAPDVYHRVRVRGHQKAERFRASRVWSELVADLRDDLDAFG